MVKDHSTEELLLQLNKNEHTKAITVTQPFKKLNFHTNHKKQPRLSRNDSNTGYFK
jgi:hypothetical protein